MAFAADLLEQAQHLARREPKRPKQASLRRSISTAYYALFHLLIAEATLNWKRPAERNALGRLFDHGLMKKACEKKGSELNAFFKTAPPPAELDLAKRLLEVADTFIRMQQDRHPTTTIPGNGPVPKLSRSSMPFIPPSKVGTRSAPRMRRRISCCRYC